MSLLTFQVMVTLMAIGEFCSSTIRRLKEYEKWPKWSVVAVVLDLSLNSLVVWYAWAWL